MTITVEQIDRWRASPSEHERLEFKEAKEQYDWRKLCEYCVALANEGGGVLLFGVANRPPRPVVGSRAFPDVTAVVQRLYETLGFRIELDAVSHPDGRVLVFRVPPRPRGTAYDLDGRYLMRAGESLVPMSEDRLRLIFDEGKPDWLEEPALDGLDAQQVVELLDTQTFFSLLRLPFPSDRAGVLDRLLAERLIDESAGRYRIRRIGALLLARRLDAFPGLERRAPRVVVYSGESKLQTRLDQTGRLGYAVGFQHVVRFVMEQLPRNEVIQDALRREVKLVSDVVIRELVANALVHQDFSVGGARVMIEIYSDRVEISNPGEPLVPPERFIDGYQSRNERLADLMRRLGICEEKSSGIDRVVLEAEIHQLPPPSFDVGVRRTCVSIFGPRPFDRMDRDDRVRACYQHASLRRVLGHHMTNQSLRERFGLRSDKVAIVSQVIGAAVDAGLVKPEVSAGGSRRFARYLPFWA